MHFKKIPRSWASCMGTTIKMMRSYKYTHIHNHSLSWLGTCTSKKSHGVELVVWAQPSKWCGHISTHTYTTTHFPGFVHAHGKSRSWASCIGPILLVELVAWALPSSLSEMMRSWKYFPNLSKIPTLPYNRVSNYNLEPYTCSKMVLLTSLLLCCWLVL